MDDGVQRAAIALHEPSDEAIRSAAAEGVRTPATSLPHLDRIQASFGRHSIAHIQAHVGPEAARASRAMNALAYASGNHVVFGGTPDLRTAAHEAAHIVQQQAGVQLSGGIGRAGDPYERHADAVADVVVAGQLAEGLLEGRPGSAQWSAAAQPAQTAISGFGADAFSTAPGAPRTTARDLRPEALQLQRSVGNAAVERTGALGRPAPALPGAVQRKVKYKDGKSAPPPMKKIVERLSNFLKEQKPSIPSIESKLEEGLKRLEDLSADYGVINLNDPQHLTLLYFWSSQNEPPPPQTEEGQPPSHTKAKEEQAHELTEMMSLPGTREAPYRVAFLGAGASIAYYLATQRFEHEEAVIIGTEQPWKKQRGPGVVGHPEHMITPMLQSLGEMKIHDQWLDRGTFSESVEEVLKDAQIEHIPHKVTALEREPATKGGFYYKITVDSYPGPIYAREVVAGIGLGEHKPPEKVDEQNIARRPEDISMRRRVIDMDVFTNAADRLKKDGDNLTLVEEGHGNPANITLVLSGGNAGIDVAFDALRRGYKVHWIVGSRDPLFVSGFANYAVYPAYLSSSKYEGKTEDKKKNEEKKNNALAMIDELYNGQGEEVSQSVLKQLVPALNKFEGIHFGYSTTFDVTDTGVTVQTDKGGEVSGDIMVFAQGPSENFELFEKFMDDLVPEKDVNQRFADEHTTIGLRSQDNTLKIIGANAYRMAAQVPDPVGTSQEMKQYSDDLHQALNSIYNSIPRSSPQHSRRPRRTGGLLDDNPYVLFSDVFLAYSEVEISAHLTEGKPDLAKEIKAFAVACRAYDKKVEGWKNTLKNEQDDLKKAVDDFDTILKKARGNVQKQMTPVIDSLPNNVLINDQLTPIRSQIVASTGFLPYDIGQRANFVTDDRTALAVHISALYEDLTDKLADEKTLSGETRFEVLIKKIIASRKKKVDGGPSFDPVPPHGKEFQDYWESKLEKLNKANPEEQEAALAELGVTRALIK